MKQFVDSLSQATVWILSAGAGALLIGIVATVGELRFRLRLRNIATMEIPPYPELPSSALALRESFIIRKSARGFVGAPGPFPGLLSRLGYPRRWLESVRNSASSVAAGRLLEYAADLGLFDCFTAALQHDRIRTVLLDWLSRQGGAFALRRIALSGPGRDFDGGAARLLLADRIDEVRELLGDPEWAARALAIRILSGDDAERTKKGLADSLADPHPLVRKLALQAPSMEERASFYEALYKLFTRDPAHEVRKAAKDRILKDFPDLYAPDMDSLGPEETIHVLEMLDTSSSRDEEIAFRFLETGDPEQKLAAAEHLQAKGSLQPLLEGANPGDAKDFARRLALLTTAASYQVSGFLSAAATIESAGSFEAASRILAISGDRRLIPELARRWFERMGPAPYPAERLSAYRSVLAAIQARGDDESWKVLSDEVIARRDDGELEAALLDATDGSHSDCMFGTLTTLFLDPGFSQRDKLRDALSRQAPALVIPFVLSFLKADRVGTPRILRRDALILSSGLKLSWALQRTLETLPTLDAGELQALATVVIGADPKAFKGKARFLLDSVDAPSRASILAVLAFTGDKSFMGDVKGGLRDADPDVRSAAVRALAIFQEDKALTSGGMDLLRDPVERVRVAAAAALAEASGAAVQKRLVEVLDDANEVDDVKASLIEGLGRARDSASLELLIAETGKRDEWKSELIHALSMRSSRKDLALILERFKDATGEAKIRMAESIRAMGKLGENALVELLGEEVISLKPFIVEALESLGYVEARIRDLKQRDPVARRDAAAALSLVASRAAYRGIVLAARDPDPDVRVAVTKALERLAGPEGESMLSELTGDPDARVRKYVLWAMERVKAKAL